MSAVMGFIGGVAGLALLDAAVSSPSTGNGATVASGDLSGAFGLVAKFLQIIIDPTRPGIANHAAASSSSTSMGSGSTSGVNSQGVTVPNKNKPKSATNPQTLFPQASPSTPGILKL